VLTVLPGKSACYRCVFDKPPPAGLVPSCSQAGVLGSLAGVIGCLQATEVLKYLLDVGKLLTDRLLIFDGLGMQFRQVNLSRNPDCRICGQKPTITKLADEEQAVCDIEANQ
ncbi:MAG: adenylyltransferase, partial [Gammaproteobacteria bacterium]|nr:adenylyltransferase [Gammaproteobacteria bacterium]